MLNIILQVPKLIREQFLTKACAPFGCEELKGKINGEHNQRREMDLGGKREKN